MTGKKFTILMVLLAFVVPMLTMAFDCPPPPPPPDCEHDNSCEPHEEYSACSPGYWKNHTEVWEDYAGVNFSSMLAGLQGGKSTIQSRIDITDELNSAGLGVYCGDWWLD
jgi:hypothetical protein